MAKHMKRTTLIFLTLAAVLAAAFSISAAGSRAYVIRNAKVYTLASAGILERASVVIEDGRITAVGKSVKTPSHAVVIKGDGLEVYPGMIDSWGNLGLTEVGSVDVTNDQREMGDYTPQLLAFSAIHPASEHIPIARVNGITACLSVPSGGVLAGQPVLMHLDGWTADEMAIEKSAGMTLSFPTIGGRRGFRGFGRRTSQNYNQAKQEYDKKVAELTEWLDKARHYAKAVKANPGTERDLTLEALVPVVEGKSTVFVEAEAARDIRNAVEFAKREKLKIVIQGGREANQVADLLKKENIPVILDSLYRLPSREDDPYDEPFTTPRDLAAAGVKFALTSPSSSDVRNLPYEAGMAQAYGLSHEEALKAVTVYPAEILGVADRIGTIEPGKIADLVVTDGDLLELRTQIKNLFIAGKNVSLETKHTKLYEKYMSRP